MTTKRKTSMLSKQQQQTVLEALDVLYDVVDVYWAKGKLFVVNDYDIPAVEDYLDVSPVFFQFQSVNEEVYA